LSRFNKEYGLRLASMRINKRKENNSSRTDKWYNRQIGNLTIGHLLAVLSFGFSIICYLIQKESDSETAKILAFFLFSHTIGEGWEIKFMKGLEKNMATKNADSVLHFLLQFV